jgi:hypothetical protein
VTRNFNIERSALDSTNIVERWPLDACFFD